MAVEIYVVLKYKDFNEGILESILNTNKNEFLEVLSKNLILLIPAAFLILLINFLIVSQIQSNLRIGLLLLVPFFIAFFSSQVRLIRVDRKLKKYAQNSSAFNVLNSLDKLDKNVISSIRTKYPIFFGNLFYLLNYRGSGEINFHENRQCPDFLKDDKSTKVKNIILIIGESAMPDRFSLYGYSDFLTTPRIKQWNNLTILEGVHSLSNMTRTALPFLISYPEVHDFSKAYTCKNIFDLAKNKNIHTSWIGNQAIDSLFTSSYGPIAKCADLVLSRDHTSTGFPFTPKDDLDLLHAIENEFKQYGMANNGSNNLFVIHTVGSHAPYSIRSDEIDKIALKGADEYDLSIHHTDRLLDEIKKLADRQLEDYMLIYTSDHGEVVEDEGGGLEHGLTFGGYQQYKVPFVILNNSNFNFNIEKYRKNSGNYANDISSLLIAEAMGYKLDEKFIFDYTCSDEILHSDYIVYDYKDLPQQINQRKRAA
ncbi:phosphoethanolamine transferase [Acinetobacter wanghuae]|nr:phosphoethanolamine transferase [Acinetobacter wanghuae]